MFAFYRIILREIGAEGLGVWSVVLASLSATKVSELGLSGSAVKYAAGRRARGDDVAASRVIETTVLTIGGIMALVAGLAYLGLGRLLPVIIPPAGQSDALALLPYACVSFWLTSVGGALQSGLDGCGRIDLRNAIVLGSQVLYVALGIWMVSDQGLVGLALAQIAQGFVMSVVLWIGIRHVLPSAPRVPWRWDSRLFREMLRYGLSFQALSLLRVLFEPTTKVLMGALGGLSAAGLYEMATLLVTKLRQLVIAAQQALTPEIAFLQEQAPERVNVMYARSVEVSTYVTIPLFCGLMVAAPFVSHVWVGAYEPTFVLLVGVLAVGWLVNTLSGPAHFLLLGTGQLRGVVWANVTTAVVNAALGATLGAVLGAAGVALGWSLALVSGAVHLLWRLWTDRGVVTRWPDRARWTVAAPLGIAAFGLVGALYRPASVGVATAALGMSALALGSILYASPLRHELTSILNRALGREAGDVR